MSDSRELKELRQHLLLNRNPHYLTCLLYTSGDVVGRHKDCSKEQTTRQQVEEGTSIHRWVVEVHNATQYEKMCIRDSLKCGLDALL